MNKRKVRSAVSATAGLVVIDQTNEVHFTRTIGTHTENRYDKKENTRDILLLLLLLLLL